MYINMSFLFLIKVRKVILSIGKTKPGIAKIAGHIFSELTISALDL